MLPTEAHETTIDVPDPPARTAGAGTADSVVVRDRIDAELIAFLNARARELAEVDPETTTLAQTLVGFLHAGGKRLRPVLCYWGWRGAGGADEPAIITAAASLELLHAFALVHDDIMDASDTRRGQPTVHRQFAALHTNARWHGDAQLFGLGAGILAGDLCLMLSDAMFYQCGLPPDVLRSTHALLIDTRTELAAGQYLDLTAQAHRDYRTTTAARIIRYKTAKYTVERPLQIGGRLAGATPALLVAYSEFGIPLGEAFQLRDDLLGAFGDEAVTGKSAIDDLRAGKPTWLIAETWQRATPTQRRRITALYGNPRLDTEGARALREIITDTGARNEIERLIATRTEQALCALERASVGDDARSALRGLARVATTRAA